MLFRSEEDADQLPRVGYASEDDTEATERGTCTAQNPSSKARRRALNHQRRQEKRQRERDQGTYRYPMRSAKEQDPPVKVTMATEKCSTAAAGFVGLNDVPATKRVTKLEELIGDDSKDFEYVAWDGW